MATLKENKVKEYGKVLDTYQKFMASDKISYTNSDDVATANSILAKRQVAAAIAGGTSVDDVSISAPTTATSYTLSTTEKAVEIKVEEYQKVGPPDDEVWYTTSNSATTPPVDFDKNTPYSIGTGADAFGANFISNTYENGKGIWKFDGAVTKMPKGVLYNHGKVTEVWLPDSAVYLGMGVFGSNLTSESKFNPALTALKSVHLSPKTSYVSDYCFQGCGFLTSIEIPNTCTYLGQSVFMSCEGLLSAKIPTSSLSSVGNGLFYNCQKMSKLNSDTDGVLNWPSSIVKIPYLCFQYCNAFTTINIPEGITDIEDGAFLGVGNRQNPTTINLPNSLLYIGDRSGSRWSRTFQGVFAEHVTIPANVVFITGRSFDGCEILKTVTCLATTPPSIGNECFGRSGGYQPTKIYVPATSVDTYKTATNWSTYASLIEAIPE